MRKIGLLEKIWEYIFGKEDYHEHTFGPWEKKVWNYQRPPRDMMEFLLWGQIYEKTFTNQFQERKYSTCGYVQQEELDYQ